MNETPSSEQPVRRVGTITAGLLLVVAGTCLLISLFFPDLDLRWALQASPLCLISLGIETLMAASQRCRIRYDWVGMLLSCLIVCTGLVFYGIAWYSLHYSEYFFFG